MSENNATTEQLGESSGDQAFEYQQPPRQEAALRHSRLSRRLRTALVNLRGRQRPRL